MKVTVGLFYEGRAAKVALHNGRVRKLKSITKKLAEEVANEYQ